MSAETDKHHNYKYDFTSPPESLEQFWMPFTPQRMYKTAPRMIVSADGMYMTDEKGHKVLDGAGGLWCVNAGHNNPRINAAITAQLETLDYACCFQMGHPTAFRAADTLIKNMPKDYTRVFFSNSGSEAVDTALKIALAYHRVNGEGTRRVLIGRERAYHGVGFGGISVGGIPYNRSAFGQLLPEIAHLPHTHDLEKNAFSKGQPEHGAEKAERLEDLIYFHGAENVAAVIVEPVSGSTGVLPPPKGYLKRLREICDEHGILLIFDEVVTGFGRFGSITSSDYFGVRPDIICFAKGITNGTVPMGATVFREGMYKMFMGGPSEIIELMHGYTYSGHPLAAAAMIGTMDSYIEDGIFENAKKMMDPWEEGVHSLRNSPRVIDLRNCGIIAAVELEFGPKDDPGKWAREAFLKLYEAGVGCRYTNNNLALSPPLILEQQHIDELFTTIDKVLKGL